jgi:hypothetical protein
MPCNWDPNVYRERAQQWRDAAIRLSPGETREANLSIADAYENLANLIAVEMKANELKTGPVDQRHHQGNGDAGFGPTLDRIAIAWRASAEVAGEGRRKPKPAGD